MDRPKADSGFPVDGTFRESASRTPVRENARRDRRDRLKNSPFHEKSWPERDVRIGL